MKMNNNYWLKNVRLECGYKNENNRVSGTITGQFHLLIEDGCIAKITKDLEAFNDDLPIKDAMGLLLLPSFVEKHVHLDKTYLGDKWRACSPASSVIERCEIEKTHCCLCLQVPISDQKHCLSS